MVVVINCGAKKRSYNHPESIRVENPSWQEVGIQGAECPNCMNVDLIITQLNKITFGQCPNCGRVYKLQE